MKVVLELDSPSPAEVRAAFAALSRLYPPAPLETAALPTPAPPPDPAIHDPDHFQNVVGEWAESTFPHSTAQSIVRHLRREVNELVACLNAPALARPRFPGDLGPLAEKNAIGDELGDCMSLLLHLAHKYGLSLDQETRRVFLRNKTRTWKQPDAEGVSEHE